MFADDKGIWSALRRATSGRFGRACRLTALLLILLTAGGVAIALEAQGTVRNSEPALALPVSEEGGTRVTGGNLASCAAEGYASSTSVVQGGAIDFHISSDCTSFDIYVFREGATKELITIIPNVQAGDYPCTHSELGCAWPIAYRLEIPRNWASGLYAAQLVGAGDVVGDQDDYILFVVREDMPGSTARILVQLSTNTWNAYTERGGQSFYTSPRAMEISYDRPYTRQPYGIGPYAYEVPLLRWLESHGYTAEYCTNVDLHYHPEILDQYPTFISVGHDEYWSKEMRDNLEGYIGRGGNVIFFSSNTTYWQVRLEDGGTKIVCYKDDFSDDPLFGIDNSRVTHYWTGWPVNRPENSLTAGSYHFGSIGAGGYKIYHADHWVFAGTGLAEGAIFGEEGDGLQAREADGAHYRFEGGFPVPLGDDGTPLNYVILGISSKLGNGMMGVYQRTGEVFTVGSWEWAPRGLATGHFVAERITRNVLDRFTLLDGPPTPTPRVTPAVARPTVVTLQQGLNGYAGVRDTYIHSWYPDSNYGNSQEMLLRPGKVVVPLIRFGDLTTRVPSTAQVLKATLSVYAISSGENLMLADVFKVLRPWEESQATWNRSKIGLNWIESGCSRANADYDGSALDRERMYATNGWYTFNVTNLVQEWLANPSSNLGLVLRSTSSISVQYNLATSQFSGQFYRPKLIIHYVEGGTPTPTATATKTPTATATPTPTRPPKVQPSGGWSVPPTLQTFTAVYEDPSGWQNIRYADLLIDPNTSTVKSIYARYDVQNRQMYLHHPTKNRWRGPMPLGTGILQHIYGGLDVSQSSVVTSTNAISVTWAILFKWRNSGQAHNLYLSTESVGGAVSGWMDEGDWVVNRTPNWLIPPTELSPRFGYADVAEKHWFDPAYRDLDKESTLDELYFLVADAKPSDDAPDHQIPDGVYLKYKHNGSAANGRLYVWNGAGWAGPYLPNDLTGEVDSPNATVIVRWSKPIYADFMTIKVLWRLQFKPTFVGRHTLYTRAIDTMGKAYGGDTGWKWKGWVEIMPPGSLPTATATPTWTAAPGSSPTPTATVTATPTTTSGLVRMRYEAESGAVAAPALTYADATASGCSYVAGPVGSGSPCEQGGVSLNIYAQRDDNYRIFTRVKSPDEGHNSFWVSIDNGYQYVWNPPPASSPSAGLCDQDGWCWDAVSDWSLGLDPVVFHLTQGNHSLRFCVRESDTRLDLVEVSTAYDFDTQIAVCNAGP